MEAWRTGGPEPVGRLRGQPAGAAEQAQAAAAPLAGGGVGSSASSGPTYGRLPAGIHLPRLGTALTRAPWEPRRKEGHRGKCSRAARPARPALARPRVGAALRRAGAPSYGSGCSETSSQTLSAPKPRAPRGRDRRDSEELHARGPFRCFFIMTPAKPCHGFAHTVSSPSNSCAGRCSCCFRLAGEETEAHSSGNCTRRPLRMSEISRAWAGPLTPVLLCHRDITLAGGDAETQGGGAAQGHHLARTGLGRLPAAPVALRWRFAVRQPRSHLLGFAAGDGEGHPRPLGLGTLPTSVPTRRPSRPARMWVLISCTPKCRHWAQGAVRTPCDGGTLSSHVVALER